MKEIDPSSTTREYAFKHWLNAPMPMVTFFKTLNITSLIKFSNKHKYKLNMLLCWCIGMAAKPIKEFYILPVNGKLYQYENIAVNTIVLNNNNEISSCDIPFNDSLQQFNLLYLDLTKQVAESCNNNDLQEYMVIGTSNIKDYEIDGAVGMYSGIFNNPFLIWGKYKRSIFSTSLKLSFQFHHTQMDGAQAAKFLNNIQDNINTIKINGN